MKDEWEYSERAIQIADQSEFIRELAIRLDNKIDSLKSSINDYYYHGIPLYTQVQADIVRLRRELMELSKKVKGYKL